jgi:hypothetical protein
LLFTPPVYGGRIRSRLSAGRVDSPSEAVDTGGMRRTSLVRFAVATALGAAVVPLSGCAGQPPSPASSSSTPIPPTTAPSGSRSDTAVPLDDGTYRAATYVPDGLPNEVLAAGTLVDLGGGCLGLETDDGARELVAFPTGTTLADGAVSAVGMAPFGLGQPLRYSGVSAPIDRPRSALALPDGCPDDVSSVWYFVVPDSAGIDAPPSD